MALHLFAAIGFTGTVPTRRRNRRVSPTHQTAAAKRPIKAMAKAPVRRVTAPHTPVPFAPVLEKLYIPSPERIATVIRNVYGYAQ